ILLLGEATHHQGWFDFTTGLIEGWHLFADGLRSDQPLLSPGQWRQALLEHGFAEVSSFPDEDSPANVFGQHLILARTPFSEKRDILNDLPVALRTDNFRPVETSVESSNRSGST